MGLGDLGDGGGADDGGGGSDGDGDDQPLRNAGDGEAHTGTSCEGIPRGEYLFGARCAPCA